MDRVRRAQYRGIVDRTGYRNVSSNDAALIAKAYWGNIPDGMEIDPIVEAKKAQDRFYNAGITEYVPLVGHAVEKAARDFWLGDTAHIAQEDMHEWAIKAAKRVDKGVEDYISAVISKADAISKADSTSSLGSSLMHVIADDKVTYLYKRPYPFQTLIPVEANMGKVANWDAIGPYEISSAAFGEEDPSLTESDMTAHNRSATIKFMYAVGRLTKAVKLAGLSQVPARDIKAIRIDIAQDALRSLRERSMLGVDRNVQSITNAFTSAAAIQYAGAYELITNNSSGAPTTGDQCWADVSASSVDTYGEIMQYLDTTYQDMTLFGMQPNVAMCDLKTFGIIRRGLSEYFRYNGQYQELIPGVAKITLTFPTIGGLNLIPHPFLPMTTGANGVIFMMDTRLITRRSLWMDTYEELANINTSEKFVISAAETLIDKSDIDGTSSLHGGVMGITI